MNLSAQPSPQAARRPKLAWRPRGRGAMCSNAIRTIVTSIKVKRQSSLLTQERR